MKINLLVVLFLSLVVIFCSCSKSNTSTPAATPTKPIVGLWIGSQIPSSGGSVYPLYYSFDIKSDSALLVQGTGGDGNTYYSVGKWSLSGTAFSATITVSNFSQAGVKQNITAIYDSIQGKLTNGTIQTVNVNYTATFSLDRIN